MKSFTRWLLVLLLVATPMMVATDFASANTELVPASRLVAPFITLQTGRSTFLLFTNMSALDFRNVTGAVGGVHLEFYDKTCARSSTQLQLSPKDIDQLDVSLTNAGALATSLIGFLDVDVRATSVFTDPLLAEGIQANAIMGEVVITDSPSDFALAYPMASSLGSSREGVATSIAGSGTIVTRNSAGAATGWSGRYEAFPSRVFVPGFFAEGSPITSTFLAVVSPADGNWHGNGVPTTGASSEAPGENLVAPSGQTLINVGAIVWDGCEHFADRPVTGHTLMDSLGGLFGASAVLRTNWTAANCTNLLFPGLDEFSTNPVGWIDLPNVATNVKGTSGTRARGMVGLLFEVQSTKGDVSRLWGDPTSVTGQSSCTFSNPSSGVGGGATACPYNLTPVTIP